MRHQIAYEEDADVQHVVLALIDEKGGTASVSEVMKDLVEHKQLSEHSVQDAVRVLLETGPLELGENLRLVRKK